MKKILCFIALFLLIDAIADAGAARASEITVDLSEPIVKITTGFSGTDLLIFGVAPGEGDVVIVVRGPIRDEIVRKKEQVMGVWVNRRQVVLENVPSLYMMASNRDLNEFLPGGIAYTHQIGVENIRMTPAKAYADVEDWETFRHALVRNKENQNLYHWKPGNLVFLGNRLFRTKVHFPANLTVGTFGIDTYLIKKGEIAAYKTTLLNVRKFGVEAGIYNFAHRHSFAYGVLAILVAGLAGWMANAAFRKS
ncbi:MAG: TIGR02186 family protein [Rhodospirillales bacterium]|nr:TIGR02186 family protein [Rhodospirillales bacterium]